MSIYPIPRYEGQITVVANVNDQIKFWDSVFGGGSECVATLTPGSYWLPALCTEIALQMLAASHGVWSAAVSNTTGILTITHDDGWVPHVTAATTRRFLTGGTTDPDTGAALGTLGVGLNHVGFYTQLADPPQATSQDGNTQVANSFYPSEPPAQDDEYSLDAEVSVLGTPNGYQYHADYSGVAKGIERRNWRYEFQGSWARWVGAYWWWKWYAKSGNTIRYYADRTVASYTDYKLVEKDCRHYPFDQRLQGYAWFSGEFTGQKVWT